MKRRVLTVVLFLLLGAIVNVAVAWGCAVNSRLPTGLTRDALSPERANTLWKAYALDASPQKTRPTGWQEHRAFSDVIWVGTSLMSTDTGSFSGFAVAPSVNDALIVETGVPLRSLRHVALDVVSTMPTMPAPPGRAPPVTSDFRWIRQAAPIWPGFVINTLFYAGVLWLLFVAPFALRRWRRIKRGLCPKCAYPVGTNTVCTECGKPVRRRIEQTRSLRG